jgi:succinoglycan biosynthesis transport protein ExoP
MLELLSVIRSKFLILVIWALAGTATAGAINLLLPVAYEAHAGILVAAPEWNDSTALADPNTGGGAAKTYGDTFTQQRMASYVRLVTTPLVADAVAKRLRTRESGEDLAKKLSGHVIPDTVMIQVRAQDDSPVRAAEIADAAAQRTIDVIKEVERPPFTEVSPVQPILTEPASVPRRPISPRTALNTVSGAVLGFLIGLTYIAAYAGVRETRLLRRFRGDGAVADGHVDVLGVLSAEEHLTADEVHVDAKLLRLEIADRLSRADSHSFVLASPRATSTTGALAALLATAFSESGSRTVVVYADFTADHDGSTVGLGDVLSTATTLDTVIQSDERSGVSWIAAGTRPENPTRALTGPAMRTVLGDLGQRYRHVIVVSPAVLESADAADMSSQLGASILVDPLSQTSEDELRESERLLGLSRGACLGRIVIADERFSQHRELPRRNQRRLAA